jgi:hypothetical protein
MRVLTFIVILSTLFLKMVGPVFLLAYILLGVTGLDIGIWWMTTWLFAVLIMAKETLYR